ncbi:MAG: hypothetical protein DDT22_01310 [candidate division WS2 bacterium]|nr:hypothetical protein [Candidatus Lithacetigena glycinireducens]
MKLLNNYNLPEAIVNAVSTYSYPPQEGRYSVTDLISPPQIRQLKMKYWDMLEEDVSQRLWTLLAQACHAVLDKHSPEEALSEEKLIVEFEGVTITGRSDLYHEERLEDYKIVSVYSFLLEDGKPKKEWENQTNVYAWMLHRTNRPVKEIWIRAILRDFKQSEAVRNSDYPAIPFQSVKVPLWTLEGQERYIRARLEAHKALNPQCSDEERWLRGEAWAVYRGDNTKALRVFDNEESANKLAETNKAFRVVYRAGTYNRCNNYCIVSKFCPQLRKERGVQT